MPGMTPEKSPEPTIVGAANSTVAVQGIPGTDCALK